MLPTIGSMPPSFLPPQYPADRGPCGVLLDYRTMKLRHAILTSWFVLWIVLVVQIMLNFAAHEFHVCLREVWRVPGWRRLQKVGGGDLVICSKNSPTKPSSNFSCYLALVMSTTLINFKVEKKRKSMLLRITIEYLNTFSFTQMNYFASSFQ